MKFLNVILVIALFIGNTHAMRLGEMWSLYGDLESAIADRGHSIALRQEQLREDLRNADEEGNAGARVAICSEMSVLRSNEEGHDKIMEAMQGALTCFQGKNHKSLLLDLLALREEIIQGRHVSFGPHTGWRMEFSQYPSLNELRFGTIEEFSSQKWPSKAEYDTYAADALMRWEKMKLNVEEEEYFLTILSDTLHSLIKGAWDGLALDTMDDESWEAINKAPSLWLYLAKQKTLSETSIDDGTIFALIKFCCDDLLAYDKAKWKEILGEVAKERFISKIHSRDLFKIGTVVCRKLLIGLHGPAQERRDIDLFADLYIKRSRKGLIRALEHLDFAHINKLGSRGWVYSPVKHPLQPKENDFTAEEGEDSWLVNMNTPGSSGKKKKKPSKSSRKTKKKPRQGSKKRVAGSAEQEEKDMAVDATVASFKLEKDDETLDEPKAFECGEGQIIVDSAVEAMGGAATAAVQGEEVEATLDIAAEMAKDYPYNYPRSVRVYNPRLLEQERDVIADLGPNQGFVDDLFEHGNHNNITFRDFKQFWETMGGRIEGDGGSHRHLVAPDGTPLWGTFKPHGHQAYGPTSIENLRAATYWIGCRPSA